jgi:uncharacterized protein Usg
LWPNKTDKKYAAMFIPAWRFNKVNQKFFKIRAHAEGRDGTMLNSYLNFKYWMFIPKKGAFGGYELTTHCYGYKDQDINNLWETFVNQNFKLVPRSDASESEINKYNQKLENILIDNSDRIVTTEIDIKADGAPDISTMFMTPHGKVN